MHNLKNTPNATKVRLASGHVHPLIGKDIMNVQTPFEEIKVICEVLYVHIICKSFLLVGFISDQGHVIFYDKGYVIKHQITQEVSAKAN